MNLYVGGDSFCEFRDNPNTDWPLILASCLGLPLQGQGFPGYSWWMTRKHLLQYKDSAEYNPSDVFVFCHSEPNRMLLDYTIDHTTASPEQLKEMYFKHFHSDAISEWTTIQWYKELNDILRGHKVLHVQCFANTQHYFDTLDGLKFTTPLMELSLKEEDGNIDKFLFDKRRNHFNTENNRQLAEQFYKLLSK